MKLTQAAAATFGLDDEAWKRQIDRFVAIYEEGLRRAAAAGS
ncbi:hypothetical protein ACFYUV_45140 [Nonomuraea sp. NPDC003560]